MINKNLSQKEKELIKRIEGNNRNKKNNPSKEDYLKQTDRNYKDGDRN